MVIVSYRRKFHDLWYRLGQKPNNTNDLTTGIAIIREYYIWNIPDRYVLVSVPHTDPLQREGGVICGASVKMGGGVVK